jgi:N-acetylmuramoyl-L-alanine amidase
MMPAIVIYLLKCIACSGILYVYYRVVFFNRISHQWNRFYLLSAVAVSLFLPLLKIYIPGETILQNTNVVRLLNVVAGSDVPYEDNVPASSQIFDPFMLMSALYIMIAAGFLLFLIRSLMRIYKLYRSCPRETFHDINLVMTTDKDTPFSFLKTIFWNTRIDLHSAPGTRILDHEMAHVRELHSVDRLIVNTITSIFWCNPFYWIIQKELIVVHEFIADHKAIGDNNTEAFSEMILLSAFPHNKFGITSTFFNSSIKRRLTMLTKINKSRSILAGKWLTIPVLLLLLTVFSFRKHDVFIADTASPFIVMIDAGHGGNAKGTTATDGTMEKDLNLSIAKKIKALNTNDNIKIVLTRESDEDTPLRDRVEQANKIGVSAFLSIHFNNNKNFPAGMELMMTKNQTPYAGKSQLLGSVLMKELNKEYKVDDELKKGRDNGQGVWVLDSPEINYPSVLIECGNLGHVHDLTLFKSSENQEKLARHILNALNQYAAGVAMN